MNDEKKTPRTRRRLPAWLLALNFVLFSSPLLPGWLALASEQSGTRLVQLCTGKGLRLVAVPVEDLSAAPHPSEEKRTGFDCAKCPLGKCAGSGFAPVLLSGITCTAAGVDTAAAADHLAVIIQIILGPPTRAPPTTA